jgi:hypothetical protein
MKEEIRRAIAHAAVVQIGGTAHSHIYSYNEGHHTLFSGSGAGGFDHAAGAHVLASGSNLYHPGLASHILLKVHGRNFNGYDHESGSHFSGSVNGNSVQLYDCGEGRYFNYTA